MKPYYKSVKILKLIKKTELKVTGKAMWLFVDV